MSRTDKLFDSFDPVSKAEWLAKVTVDLKGKPIDNLTAKWASGRSVSPFYHSDDLTEDIQIPLGSSLGPVLGLEVKVKDADADNKLILEGLEGGVSHLDLDLTDAPDVDFSSLFDNVLLNLVHLRMESRDQTIVDSFTSYIFDHYDLEQVGDNITFCTTDAIETSFSQVETCKSDHSSTTLLTFLKESHVFIGRGRPGPFVYRVSCGHHYTQNIVDIRAARLLWANLCDLHEVDPDRFPLIIEGKAEIDELSMNEDSNKIALSQIAVSMMSANLDVVFIPPSNKGEQDNGTPFTRRISRNIFNLLMMEGHMNRVIDPASGSYLFDRLTVDTATEAWEQFKNLN